MNINKFDDLEKEIAEELDVVKLALAANASDSNFPRKPQILLLKKEIDLVLSKVVVSLYTAIRRHPLTLINCKVFDKQNESPNTLTDCINILKDIKILISKGNSQEFSGGELSNDFLNYLENIILFSSMANKIITRSSVDDELKFLNSIEQNLLKMKEILESSSSYLLLWKRFDGEAAELIEKVNKLFIQSTDAIDGFIKEYTNLEQNLNHNDNSKKSKIINKVVNVPNEKEIERLNSIKKANDLYDRFCIDFLRDLQKEVSMMNRDAYEALIDKFERFKNTFQMPLSNDVSIGMANEAYTQISKMIETVYDISRNTYSPVVFNR